MYYLIDYENLGNNAIIGANNLNKDDNVVIFYNENSTIKLNTHIQLEKCVAKKEYYNVKSKTSNALDFQLSSYVGSLIKKEKNICIISKDRGFQAVVDFWKEKENFDILIGASILDVLLDFKLISTEYYNEKEKIEKIIIESQDKRSLHNSLVKTFKNTMGSNLYKLIKNV